MDTQTLSLLILGIGVILVVLSLFLRRDDHSRRADRGGVVVGGDNPGVINTGRMGGGGSSAPGWERWIGIVGALCGIAGLLFYLNDRFGWFSVLLS